MRAAGGKKSLQQVLRERRAATPLATAAELATREAARRRAELGQAATETIDRWRAGEQIDRSGGLAAPLYAEVFRRSRQAYYESAHWARRTRAQLAHAGACEVQACSSAERLAVQHLRHDALGEEEPGRDLITLCEGCRTRATKLAQTLGRLPTRPEVTALDPQRALYERGEIAALRAKYGS